MANKPEYNGSGCNYKSGDLPRCGVLSAAYIPWQQDNSPKYDNTEALTRGTLFPGLDLPFMNVANKNNPYAGTHLGDLMALDFVIRELNLYLDTHKEDNEAFNMLKSIIELSNQAHERYVKLHGPIMLKDLSESNEYNWLHDPWPWEFSVCEVAD
ncbi:MAG: spore coat protein CotJB [Oscillospiraceae bacterium]|nr:spore coat protein CotJB [Oscillospiraceae bacterium]